MNAAVLSWGYDMVYIDNWGIPLWASAMTVDASGVAQRSSIGEWHWMHVYWAMCSVQQLNSVKFTWPRWSLFNCAIIGQFFYIHCTEMNTDVDEVEHMTVDVGDVDHQHQRCNRNDERNWFGVRYLHRFLHLSGKNIKLTCQIGIFLWHIWSPFCRKFPVNSR